MCVFVSVCALTKRIMLLWQSQCPSKKSLLKSIVPRIAHLNFIIRNNSYNINMKYNHNSLFLCSNA